MSKQLYLESRIFLSKILKSKPIAYANISGGKDNKDIKGEVLFFSYNDTSIVVSFIYNLPKTKTNIFGFHIHQNGNCDGDFSSSGPHLGNGDHPNHKGDLPVLFSNNGFAFSVFNTNRFTAKEIIGRSIIIHQLPDDYSTQPAGNSGKRIACGLIEAY